MAVRSNVRNSTGRKRNSTTCTAGSGRNGGGRPTRQRRTTTREEEEADDAGQRGPDMDDMEEAQQPPIAAEEEVGQEDDESETEEGGSQLPPTVVAARRNRQQVGVGSGPRAEEERANEEATISTSTSNTRNSVVSMITEESITSFTVNEKVALKQVVKAEIFPKMKYVQGPDEMAYDSPAYQVIKGALMGDLLEGLTDEEMRKWWTQSKRNFVRAQINLRRNNASRIIKERFFGKLERRRDVNKACCLNCDHQQNLWMKTREWFPLLWNS